MAAVHTLAATAQHTDWAALATALRTVRPRPLPTNYGAVLQDRAWVTLEALGARHPAYRDTLRRYRQVQQSMPQVLTHPPKRANHAAFVEPDAMDARLLHDAQTLAQIADDPVHFAGLAAWLRGLHDKMGHTSGALTIDQALDVLRTFFELDEAVRQSDSSPATQVRIGCDFSKAAAPGGHAAAAAVAGAGLTVARRTACLPNLSPDASFDVEVRSQDGQVIKRIEVTSIGTKIDSFRSFENAVRHVTDKAIAEDARICAGQKSNPTVAERHEGTIAVSWGDTCDVYGTLHAVVHMLNTRPQRSHRVWHNAAIALDGLTIVGANAAQPRVWGTLTKRDNHWHLERTRRHSTR